MEWHLPRLNDQSGKRTIPGSLAVCILAISLLIIVSSTPQYVQASGDDITFVSYQEQNRNGERELRESTPVIGQIFTTGSDRAKYELTEITSRFDNTGGTNKFDLGVALHLVTSANGPGAKVVDMTGNLRESKTNHWSPASTTILEPNTRYMIVFRCNGGDNDDENCNGSGEEIEIKLTHSDNEDGGKSDGWSIANTLYIEDADGNSYTHWRPARIEVKGRSADVPYIVSNGVQMHEVSHGEAGGWGTRTIGDDTYGNGELIAVSVEFSTGVVANSDSTFRIKIGSATRDLAPVSARGNTVIFATLVRSSERDSNGIWIGNNTATLDHNPADAIRSTGDFPRNADLTHARLGTQSNHKVDGSKTRPRLKNIRITSSPQHADAYVRGETVTVEAKFDRAVVASGILNLRLNVHALQTPSPRYANYVDGSGTSTLVFEHVVTLLENDSDGIVIPKNALAEDGDLATGVHGGGSIVGQQGELLADLASRKRGPLSAHKVDARFAAVPEIMAAVLWDWQDDTPASDSLTMDFSINEDPGHFSETDVLVAALAWGHINGVRFAVGLRTDVDKPGTDGSQGKGVLFNRWDTADTSSYSRTTGNGWVETGQLGGQFISVRRSYNWREGDYSLRIAQDGADDDDGRWFGFWITKKSTNVETKLGSMKFALSDDGEATIQARNFGLGSLIAILGDGALKPHEIPVFELAFSRPNASGGDDPNAVNVTYSQLHGVMTNSNISYDSGEDEVTIRAGGTTLRTTTGSTISFDDE